MFGNKREDTSYAESRDGLCSWRVQHVCSDARHDVPSCFALCWIGDNVWIRNKERRPDVPTILIENECFINCEA
jgi:hypothetical protein